MSQVDQQRVISLAEAMQAAFGNSKGASMIEASGGSKSVIEKVSNDVSSIMMSMMEKEQLEGVKIKVEEIVKDKGLGNDVKVTMEERGIKISISSRILFEKGNANMEGESLAIVNQIGGMLKELQDRNIRVEGHTDNDPINTAIFPSNWELSSARSDAIVRYLVNNVGLDPSKVSTVGYSEYRPIVPNDTEENKAKNRRVDIVIMRSIYDSVEAR